MSESRDRDPLADEPFNYRHTKNDRVQIFRSGRLAVTLRGEEARRFLAKAASADPRTAQLLMAKATGQFKFGNERVSKEKGKGR